MLSLDRYESNETCVMMRERRGGRAIEGNSRTKEEKLINLSDRVY